MHLRPRQSFFCPPRSIHSHRDNRVTLVIVVHLQPPDTERGQASQPSIALSQLALSTSLANVTQWQVQPDGAFLRAATRGYTAAAERQQQNCSSRGPARKEPFTLLRSRLWPLPSTPTEYYSLRHNYYYSVLCTSTIPIIHPNQPVAPILMALAVDRSPYNGRDRHSDRGPSHPTFVWVLLTSTTPNLPTRTPVIQCAYGVLVRAVVHRADGASPARAPVKQSWARAARAAMMRRVPLVGSWSSQTGCPAGTWPSRNTG